MSSPKAMASKEKKSMTISDSQDQEVCGTKLTGFMAVTDGRRAVLPIYKFFMGPTSSPMVNRGPIPPPPLPRSPEQLRVPTAVSFPMLRVEHTPPIQPVVATPPPPHYLGFPPF